MTGRVGVFARRTLLVILAVVAVWWWWQRRIVGAVDASAVAGPSLDDYIYYYPTLRYAFGELRAGHLPLWNPHQHAGSPFLATAQHLLFYPLAAAYLWLPTGAAEEATALLHLALALLGTVFLGRTLGQSGPAAVVAGVTFTFSPPVAHLVFLPHHLYAVAWMSVLLALAHRVCAHPERWRWVASLGACAALQYVGGYPMYVLMTAYTVAAYCAWQLWGTWRTPADRRRLRAAVVSLTGAAALALALGAPQLLPAAELARASTRGRTPLPFEHAALNSLRVGESLLRAVLPMRDEAPMFTSVYVGLPALLLAALAIAAPPARRAVGFFAVLMACSWLLALGSNTPLFAFYYHLPGGGAFRFPFRFVPLTSLGLAVLAGFGTDALGRTGDRSQSLRILLALALGLGLVALVAGRWVPLPTIGEPSGGKPFSMPIFPTGTASGPLVTALGWSLLGTALWLSWYLWCGVRGRRTLVWTLPIVTYAALFPALRNTAPLPATHPDLHTMPERAVAYLHAVQGWDRTYVAGTGWPFTAPGRYLPARAGILHGLYVIGDRENVYLARFADYVARLLPQETVRGYALVSERLGLPTYVPQGEVLVTASSPNLRLFDLLGVRFVVGPSGTVGLDELAPDRFPLVFEGDGVRILRNTGALPRTFLVQRVDVVADADLVLDRLTAADFDPRTTAIVERAPSIALASGPVSPVGSARIGRYEPERVEIDVEAPAPALLVLTDQAYPGWEATVDGQPADILVTNYLFRGVAVRAGSHRVIFRFVPRTLRLGVVVGLAGVVTLAAAAGLRRRYAAAQYLARIEPRASDRTSA